MKLCRFELNEDPGVARSGIYHENRVYETDGKNAIGVHDLGRLRFLAPIGTPTSLRFLHQSPLEAPHDLVRIYGHPRSLEGVDAQLEVLAGETELDLELRLGWVIKDDGDSLEPEEAAGFILGYLPIATLLPRRAARNSVTAGVPWYAAREDAWTTGALLSTSDDWESAIGPDVSWNLVLEVNGQEIVTGTFPISPSVKCATARLSQILPIRAGDLILSPPLAIPPIAETSLGRWLRPGDQIAARETVLGRLAFQVV